MSVSSITAASFKLMHNRAPQSTFFFFFPLIVTCRLTVHDGENQKKKKKSKQKETDRGVKVTSLFLSYLHLRCCALAGQPWMGDWRGWGGHWCQALTVHCVKLVIISSLKRCPVTGLSPACSRRDGRRDLEAGCVCQGGKSLL